jgi:NDP-sugar pyrophosphorylase family protein
VVYGDVLTALDLDAIAAFHRERQAQINSGALSRAQPWECGLVDIDAVGRIALCGKTA